MFAKNEFAGRWFGTMCLSEPQAGSSLSDVATRAVPDGAGFEADALGPRYRLKGHKMWISGGEHELTENIVHLVLAKIPEPVGQPVPGARGISLFVVPKRLVNERGELTGERNDVALVGLNHKLGFRGTTNTLLNFGEGTFPVRSRPGAGAIGYLVGQPGEGLRCMFHMMNEARIGVGLGAVMLGYAGYEASLAYARQRPQGRPVGPAGKDAAQPQVPIIEHADVKRMLLAQKSYVEGGLALELYCARLVDELHTGDAPAAREAGLLLEVLTPIAKSWPSEWCLEANSLAIQVLGGYGYTRDFPVEQYWRDNRLNMIHEGTHGIQALDLLGRKVVMDGGAGLKLLATRIGATVAARRPGRRRWPSRPMNLPARCRNWAPRPRPPGPPAWPKRRWPTPRPTCRPSATWCSRGCGWTWRWPCCAPAGAALRRANWRRCATSSPTSCPGSMPGSVSWPARSVCRNARRLVLTMTNMALERLIWILIFGGLFLPAWACSSSAGHGLGWGLVVAGGVASAVGVVLVWVRSRMND